MPSTAVAHLAPQIYSPRHSQRERVFWAVCCREIFSAHHTPAEPHVLTVPVHLGVCICLTQMFPGLIWLICPSPRSSGRVSQPVPPQVRPYKYTLLQLQSPVDYSLLFLDCMKELNNRALLSGGKSPICHIPNNIFSHLSTLHLKVVFCIPY